MRTRFLPLAGVAVALALVLPAASSATGCAPPYCPSHTLKVNKGGNGNGTVVSSPAGINCGPTCSASYEEGTTVTLTATAAPGSTFDGWAGAGCSGTGACVVTIQHNTTVTAIFHAHPPPPNNFSLQKVKHPATGVVTIRVKVPGPGTVKASGKKMRTVKARAKAAGTFTLKLRLTKQGLKILKRSKGRQLRVRVSFVYTPTGGQSRTKIKKLIFRVVGKGHRRNHRHGHGSSHRASASASASAEEPSGGKVVVAAAATVKSSKALIRVFCNGPQSCQGTLKLIASGSALGSTSFSLVAGSSTMLNLKLTGHARKLVKSGSLPKQGRAAGSGLHPHSVKLKPAKG